MEAELGTIGDTGNTVEGGVSEIIYTDPKVAQDFIEKTGVDSLAVAIGTAHGIYPKDVDPKLRLDILEEIEALTDIPLVLHGAQVIQTMKSVKQSRWVSIKSISLVTSKLFSQINCVRC